MTGTKQKATRQRGKRQPGRSPLSGMPVATVATMPENGLDEGVLAYPPDALQVTQTEDWDRDGKRLQTAMRILDAGLVAGFCATAEEACVMVADLVGHYGEDVAWAVDVSTDPGHVYIGRARDVVVRGTDAGMETEPQLSAAEQCVLNGLRAFARGDASRVSGDPDDREAGD